MKNQCANAKIALAGCYQKYYKEAFIILIDYNQVSLSAILTFTRDLTKSGEEVRNLIRHVVISNILQYKKKYGSKYGEIVICCDGRKYWRKEVFPYYKGDRKKSRDKSNLDWNLIFNMLDEMRTDLKTIFPYKVIHLDRAEADDVIATLCKWSQENELGYGVFQEPQKMMIISSDHDFLQLQKFDNVDQFSPKIKKQLTMGKRDLYEKYITHIVKAGDDGIPNILSSDDCIVTDGKRQTPVPSKRLEEFLERGKDACLTDEEKSRWDRNEQLISFDFIPKDVEDEIISAYIDCKPNQDRMKLMTYLATKKCRLLLDELNNF